jgi:hypothetical protein
MQKCDIDCIKWKHKKSSLAGVVMVSTDVVGATISNSNFIGYLNMLSGAELLRRVVVDECYFIFMLSK